jgi:hypothetical protein
MELNAMIKKIRITKKMRDDIAMMIQTEKNCYDGSPGYIKSKLTDSNMWKNVVSRWYETIS